MAKRRTKLEMFMRKIAGACGFKFRFHRLKKERISNYWLHMQNNHPRIWSFEWWKPISDDQLLLNTYDIPNDGVYCKTKDEAIEHVLFKSAFTDDLFGHHISNYEQLMCELDLRGIEHDGIYSNEQLAAS